jgi:hypothetical protein
MGLCFKPEDDEALARGWPNCVVPVDGHKSDKSPAKSAMRVWQASDPIHFTEWPRETLYRFMRGAITTLFDARRTGLDDLVKAFDTPGAPSAKESLDALRQLFVEGYDTYRFKERDFVYAVETIAGTDATLMVIAEEIERSEIPAKNPGLNHLCRAAVADCAAFLMLRASPKVVKDARARLARGLAKRVLGEDFSYYFDSVDCVVHGAAGVKRTMGQYIELEVRADSFGATLDFAGDDPAYVRDMFAQADKKRAMSVRIAAIAGPEVLAGLELRKWPAAQMPSVVRDFGMVRDPAIVPFMLSLVGKSSVKEGPLAWFQAHAAYVKPILQKQKGDGAKMVLRQL